MLPRAKEERYHFGLAPLRPDSAKSSSSAGTAGKACGPMRAMAVTA